MPPQVDREDETPRGRMKMVIGISLEINSSGVARIRLEPQQPETDETMEGPVLQSSQL